MHEAEVLPPYGRWTMDDHSIVYRRSSIVEQTDACVRPACTRDKPLASSLQALAMLHGFLNIDKPAGPTSHDVVACVRRMARQRRVGHAGTLDPAATGVLVVALGAATPLIEYVQEAT